MNLRLLISFLTIGFLSSLNAQLYINEVSQGTGNKEYVELIVVGNSMCGDSTANLQGWILDDNCGFFGGAGIAGGHIKFSNDPQWAAVKFGTLILVYRGDDPFPGIVADENDANDDNVFILPSTSSLFISNSAIPTGGTEITTYTNTDYNTGTGNWDMLGMANSSDAFQTVSPSDLTSAYHSVGWGSSISGTDIYFGTSASGLTFANQSLDNNNPRDQANWVSIDSETTVTIGSHNSPPNNIWILSLLDGTATEGALYINVLENENICNGDSVFLENEWQNTAGTYFDTIVSSGGTQTDTIYTETFDGPTFWTINDALIGDVNGANANLWEISDDEGGVLPNGCGVGDNGDATLHITNSLGIGLEGATYFAGGFGDPTTQISAISNDISTLGYSDIVLTFDYIANGEGLLDNTLIYYSVNSGTVWSLLESSLKSPAGACFPQGQWTAANYNLPVSTENISNLKFRFYWVNDNNSIGSDPSCAINNFRVAGNISIAAGCDTLVQTNLTVTNITNTVDTTVCSQDSIFLENAWQNTNGTYYDTITLLSGCDSVLQTNLTMTTAVLLVPDFFPACDSFTVNGITYYSDVSMYIDSFYLNGCLSSYTHYERVVIYSSTSSVNISICSNDSVYLENAWRNTSDVYTDVFTGANGCDSTIITTLTVNPVFTTTENIYICGDSYILPDGIVVNASGTYTSTVLNGGLCDSVITTNLSLQGVVVNNITNCSNSINSYVSDTIFSMNSCDSIINNITTVLVSIVNENSITCTNIESEVGASNDTIYSIGGCDSVYVSIQSNLVALETENLTDIEINEGESSNIFGIDQNLSGTYSDTIISELGCDSIIKFVTLIVRIIEDVQLIVPSAFSPNSDLINDTFRIVNQEQFKEINLRIYNRWGELIFQSTEDVKGWDGFYKNMRQPIDSYIYYIDAIDKGSNKKISITGSVSLFK